MSLRSQQQARKHPVLVRNQAARNSPGAYAPRAGLGVPAFAVPMEDLKVLYAIRPALASTDTAERMAAWLEFAKEPESLPYRLTTAAL